MYMLLLAGKLYLLGLLFLLLSGAADGCSLVCSVARRARPRSRNEGPAPAAATGYPRGRLWRRP